MNRASCGSDYLQGDTAKDLQEKMKMSDSIRERQALRRGSLETPCHYPPPPGQRLSDRNP